MSRLSSSKIRTVASLPLSRHRPVAYQSETHGEVMANIREAAGLYIEDYIAAGDAVPNEAGRTSFER